MNNEKAKIIFHRMESLDMIKSAFETVKADGVEIDVRKAPDGNFYLTHDKPDWNDEDMLKDLVPIDDVFKYVKNKSVRLNCDMKDIADIPGFMSKVSANGVEKQVYLTGSMNTDAMAEYADVLKNVDIYFNIEEIVPRESGSGLPTKKEIAQLCSPEFIKMLADIVENGGAAGLNTHKSAVSPELIKVFHDRGLIVSVWTVDNPDEIKLMLEYGVDYLTTNNPDEALKSRDSL